MILRTKIIIGSILTVLWIVLCVFLSLMPEPKETNFSYKSQINAQEYYSFNITNYTAKIIHTVVDGNEEVVKSYMGEISHSNGGGTIIFSESEMVEQAFDLEINTQNINLLGQKNVTAFKYVGDYVIVYLGEKYICFTQDNFKGYNDHVGLYGKTFKDFKNPNIDVYIKQGETNIKEILFDEIYAVNANGKCNEKYFNSIDEIQEILYNQQAFVADKTGTYKLIIKTAQEEVNINVKVYDDNSSPYKNILQISSNSLEFNQTDKNNINEFLNYTQLKIRRASDTTFVNVTSDMVQDLRTDKLGRQVFKIKYNGLTYFAEAIIYNGSKNTIEYLKTNQFLFITKESDSEFLNDLTISEYYLNGTVVKDIAIKNNSEVEIDGFNEDKCLKQIVTIKYKGHKTKILVIVLNEEDFDYYQKYNTLPN